MTRQTAEEGLPARLAAYRPNVGVCLLSREGRVWVGARVGMGMDPVHAAHRWQMPQGGIDPGEDPERAAMRELSEETGVTSVRLLTMTPGWLTYDFPEGYKKGQKWRGQRQRWAVMLFEGTDDEVDLAPPGHDAEFDDWRWATPEEAVAGVVPFKRRVYEALAGTITPLAAYVREREGAR